MITTRKIKTVDYTRWHSSATDEPRDQNRDLSGPYMAQVGPDDRHQPGGWAWTVIDAGSGDEVAGTFAADEAAAKAAVQEWAETNLWVWFDDIGGGYVNVVTSGAEPGEPCRSQQGPLETNHLRRVNAFIKTREVIRNTDDTSED